MSDLARMALLNAALAAGLALPVALACRYLRRPALIHGLWLVVLLRLLTPPLLGVAILPRPETPPARLEAPGTPSASEAALVEATTVAPTVLADPEPIPVAVRRLPSLPEAAGAAWVAGALAVLLLALARGRRFQRLLRTALPAPPEVQLAAAGLGRRMGLRRVPPVRMVDARIAPMLWWRLRGVELLLPTGLIASLPPAARDALLAHELAHLRRRDHWVRLLELAATAAFWWSPVTWWTRVRLRRAEERSCDAWVVRILPDGGRPYADALLDTLTFLSGRGGRLPALASGIGEVHDYEERLTMILRPPTTKNLRSIHRLALAAIGIAVLLAFPTWAERPPAPPAPPAEPGPEPAPAPLAPAPVGSPGLQPASAPLPPAPPAEVGPEPSAAPLPPAGPEPVLAPLPPGPRAGSADDGIAESTPEREQRYHEMLQELERQATELEYQLQQLRMRQQEIQHELHQHSGAREAPSLEDRAAALEAAGRAQEAEQANREREIVERKVALEQAMMAMHVPVDAQQAEAKQQMNRAMMELERAMHEGDAARVEELRAQLQDMKRSYEQAFTEAARHQHDAAEEYRLLAIESLRARSEAARQAGRLDEAQAVEHEMQELLRETEVKRRQRIELRRREVIELQKRVEALEAAGQHDEADAIRRELERLEAVMEQPSGPI